jgi:hypothetical protein
MRSIVSSIEGEFLRYKALAEGAMRQLADEQLSQTGPPGSNSVATIVWHLSGNLTSRFTDFLTTDGEKPWRDRDQDFVARTVTRSELQQKWDQGWRVLVATLGSLTDAELSRTVTIRGQSFQAHEALHRSLAHIAYHVGQIVYIAKSMRGAGWTTLSIPVGGSKDYNRNPSREQPLAHAAHLRHEKKIT